MRIHAKFYRLIFTGLMAMLMSLIISSSLLLLKMGWSNHFIFDALHTWGTAFMVAWPAAYICAYLIQEHVLSRVEFHRDEEMPE